MTTSTNCAATASSVAASTSPLNAMMPPNADVRSVASAFPYASSKFAALATPHGLACLTITHVGSANRVTHVHAASASATLLYDSSLPCSCLHDARLPTGGDGSRYRAAR